MCAAIVVVWRRPGCANIGARRKNDAPVVCMRRTLNSRKDLDGHKEFISLCGHNARAKLFKALIWMQTHEQMRAHNEPKGTVISSAEADACSTTESRVVVVERKGGRKELKFNVVDFPNTHGTRPRIVLFADMCLVRYRLAACMKRSNHGETARIATLRTVP
jgi:hypothetical protein